jgi:hypothetical protein
MLIASSKDTHSILNHTHEEKNRSDEEWVPLMTGRILENPVCCLEMN